MIETCSRPGASGEVSVTVRDRSMQGDDRSVLLRSVNRTCHRESLSIVKLAARLIAAGTSLTAVVVAMRIVSLP